LLGECRYGGEHAENKEVKDKLFHDSSKIGEAIHSCPFKVQNDCQTSFGFSTPAFDVYLFMSSEMSDEFEVGDAVVVLGPPNDGKVGTVLRETDDDNHYLIVLEDGKETILSGKQLALRH